MISLGRYFTYWFALALQFMLSSVKDIILSFSFFFPPYSFHNLLMNGHVRQRLISHKSALVSDPLGTWLLPSTSSPPKIRVSMVHSLASGSDFHAPATAPRLSVALCTLFPLPFPRTSCCLLCQMLRFDHHCRTETTLWPLLGAPVSQMRKNLCPFWLEGCCQLLGSCFFSSFP